MSSPTTLLETQLAQRLMIGYAPGDPWFKTMLALGVGGIIFFRQDFEGLDPAQAVETLLARHADLHRRHNPQAHALWLGLDQEGGQVERLPQSWFPAGLSPQAVARANVASNHYAMLAQSLAALGLNLNFFPTLDVNLTPDNPIIGIRAFGDDPATVCNNGQAALEAFRQAGVMPVIKHFPGHGNGVVDSHEQLPTLTFSPEELEPFRQAIDWGAPVVMVSHGHYPVLDPVVRPATLSLPIATGLLRDTLGFTGVSVTDDMEMGAVWGPGLDPVETALTALNSGMDLLLYRRGDATTMGPIWDGLLNAARAGRLDPVQHNAALERLARIKQQWPRPAEVSLQEACRVLTNAQKTAQQLAHQALLATPLPLEKVAQTAGLPWTVILPEPASLPHYGYDIPEGHPPLETWLRESGLSVTAIHHYTLQTSASQLNDWLAPVSDTPRRLLIVTWLPKLGQPLIQTFNHELAQLKSIYPLRIHAPIGVQARPWVHADLFDAELNLHSYREPHHRALVEWLSGLD